MLRYLVGAAGTASIIVGGAVLMPSHMWFGGAMILLGMGLITLSNHVPSHLSGLVAVFKGE